MPSELVRTLIGVSAFFTVVYDAVAREAFTVADSIAMTRLVDPDVGIAAYDPPVFKISPNNQKLAMVLSRGDSATGLADYWISILDTQEVLTFVNNSNVMALPRMDRAVSFATAANVRAIDRLEWRPDSWALLFLAKDGEQNAQVYQFDIRDRRLTRLTAHDSDVTRFALSRDGERLVYAAVTYPDWTDRNSRGYAFKSEYVGALTWTNPKDMPAGVRHYVLNLKSAELVEVEMSPSRYADRLDLSLSGRYAAFVVFDIEGFPSKWLPYERVKQRARIDALAIPDAEDVSVGNDAFGSRSNWFGRLLSIDTVTGQSNPLLSSPAMPQQGLRGVWSSDDASILVLNAWLPIDGITDPVELQRRTHQLAVAELHRSDGHAERLMDVPDGLTAESAEWVSKEKVCVRLVHQDTHEVVLKRFARRGLKWREVQSAVHCSGQREQRVRFQVRQGINLPYEILAKDAVTSRERVITDLNPQLGRFDLGTVVPFNWADQFGRQYEGGLLLPPDYDRSKHYPVVIQTYGFDSSTFVVDGPFGITSAYAARSLAGAGMLVLQMPLREKNPSSSAKSCIDWTVCGENPMFQAKMDSAIDAMVAQDRIDENRVGIMGFSREGMHVFHAVTFTQHAIAAATIADSIGPSPFAYTLFYGFPYPGMLEYEDPALMGAPFWGDGILKWQERSPLFHLSRVRAPLRFETYGKGLPGYWDSFALLKRANRPVDLIHLPLASHVLLAPFARYTSQQGNVDWFRFWLKNEESEDQTKKDQYVRWRRLRAQRQSVVSE